jgi:Xaa-Pro aminopeptidase
MTEEGIDAVLVHLWPNRYYFSGHYQHLPGYPVEVETHSEQPLIIFREEDKDPVYLAAYLTTNGVRIDGTWIEDVRIIDKEPLGKMKWWDYIAEVLKEKGVPADGTIGIEREVIVLNTFDKLQEGLPKAQFKAVDEIICRLRMVKDADEIALIKESVQIAEAAIEVGMETAKVGVLETEIIKAAEIEAKRRGGLRFVETMCESGIRTSLHRAWAANWKKVEENDLVMIDFGVVYKGYGSDLTRTWIVGKATDAQKKINDDLVRARQLTLDALKPGVTIAEILGAGNNYLKSAGYIAPGPPMPTNTTGQAMVGMHGIGLGPMHDPPRSRDQILESDMVVAVSGTVRYPDFTIRHEDNFVVTPGGYELINKGLPWQL